MFPACSVLNSMAYPKSGTGDSKPLVEPETRDPGPIIQVRPGIVEVRPNTRDPGTISWVGPGTRDPRSGALVLHGTQDLKPGTLKERPDTPMTGEIQN